MTTTSFNIIQPFLEATEKHPEKTALIQGDQKISYAHLLERVKQKAAYFQAKKIGKGDRVLVFVPMSIELYETVLALFYMGAVAVFLDEWVNKKRLDICCRMAGCKGFIAPAKIRLLGWTSKEVRKIPVWLKTKKYSTEKTALQEMQQDETALVTFTTGSTGIPKAANRTHGFLHAQFNALLSEIHPGPNDIDMPVLPIVLLMNLGAGCTSMISSFSAAKPHKTDFANIAAEINTHQVNRIECSPDFVIRLSHYLTEKKINLPSVKHIFTGGAPVFPMEAKKIQEAFPAAHVRIVYGSTEAEPIAVIDATTLAKAAQVALPAGKIHHGANVMIIPISDEPLSFGSMEALKKHALPNGKAGEIIVSGAHVLSAYIANPDAEKRNKIFVEGTCWHRTGDSGILDDEGNLSLCGRASMVFEKNGITYYPFTLEKLVRESGLASIGTILQIEHEVIVFAEGKQENEKSLSAYLAANKIGFDRLIMLPKIPRDKRHFSKIDYALLQRLNQ